MEKRIDLEKRGRNAAEINDLKLDNTRSTTIMGLTSEFVNLEVLSLVKVGLITLKGFPDLPNLKRLDLSDNLISNGLHHLAYCKKLNVLNLSGNKIFEIKELEPLKQFKNLNNLDLFNNEVTSVANYRSTVLKMIPTLQLLDEIDVNSKESEDEEVQDRGENEVEDDDEDDDDHDHDHDHNDDEDDDEENDDEDFDSSEEEPLNKSMDLRAVYNDNLDELSDDEFKLDNNNSAQLEESDDDEEEDDDDDDDDDAEDEEEFKENLSRGKKRKYDEPENSLN